jgi:PAS domain S-box-containing protein
MAPTGSAPDVSPEQVRQTVFRTSESGVPYTTADIAEELDCPVETAEEHLGTLVEEGELRTRASADGTQVWWSPSPPTDSADAKAELREFGAFVSAVKDYAIFMLDPDGTVASWNEGAKRIKGYTEADIVGEHFSTFYTEEDTENGVPDRNLEKAAEEGRAEDEGWRVRQDGSRFWANVVITAIRDDDGELQGFTKVTRDMTEQHAYELQIQQERDLIEQILETVPVGICVVDGDSEFVRTNQQMLDVTGLERADIGDRSISSLELYDDEGEPIPADELPWTQVMEEAHPVYDFQCRTPGAGGDHRWLSINAVPLEYPRSDDSRVIVSIDEITNQKDREQQLEQRKSELETELSGILGRISDAFFALDEDWQFTHLNEQAADLFEQSDEDLFGRSFWDVFPSRSGGQLRDEFEAAMETQEPTNFELYDEDIDAWLEYNVYPSESGLSIYIHDITDRREYQRRLEESNERLEQFAYAASHDLQEPLRMVSSYLQLLERRYEDEFDSEAREFLEFAVDGADRMREMIEGLLEYSRVESRGEPFEPVDLDDVLADVRDDLQMRITESDAELTVESLPRVEGDRSQLRQVFQNLLENAIKYAGDKPPQIHVDAERDGTQWRLTVSDTGIGFDPEQAEQVFEVFERLHTSEQYSGTGTGLALCERIIERHGGDIWVDSEPGEGTTFSFTLPAVTEPDE